MAITDGDGVDYEEDFSDGENQDGFVENPPDSPAESVRRFPSAVQAARKPSKSSINGSAYVRNFNQSTRNLSAAIAKRSFSSTANRTMTLPPVSMGSSNYRTAKDPAGKVLTAKLQRVQELEDERNTLRNDLEEMKKEVRVLNQTLRRQEKALLAYEGREEKSVLLKNEEETRVLREHLRTARHKYAQIRELNRQLETHAVTLEKERDKLLALVNEKRLHDAEVMRRECANLRQELSQSEQKVKDLERELSILKRSKDRSDSMTIVQLKKQLALYDDLIAENAVLREQLMKNGLLPKPNNRAAKADGLQGSASSKHVRAKSLTRDPQFILENANPMFLQRFRHATGSQNTTPKQSAAVSASKIPMEEDANPKEVSNGSATPANRQAVHEPTQINRWKGQTSPDLLRHHSQAKANLNPSSTNSSISSVGGTISPVENHPAKLTHEVQIEKSVEPKLVTRKPSIVSVDNEDKSRRMQQEMRSVDPAQAKKNELLQKIRMLDLAAEEEPVTRTATWNPVKTAVSDGFQAREVASASVKPSSQVPESKHQLSNYQSDDEIEEIEFF